LHRQQAAECIDGVGIFTVLPAWLRPHAAVFSIIQRCGQLRVRPLTAFQSSQGILQVGMQQELGIIGDILGLPEKRRRRETHGLAEESY